MDGRRIKKIIKEELYNNGLEYFYDKVICNSNKKHILLLVYNFCFLISYGIEKIKVISDLDINNYEFEIIEENDLRIRINDFIKESIIWKDLQDFLRDSIREVPEDRLFHIDSIFRRIIIIKVNKFDESRTDDMFFMIEEELKHMTEEKSKNIKVNFIKWLLKCCEPT